MSRRAEDRKRLDCRSPLCSAYAACVALPNLPIEERSPRRGVELKSRRKEILTEGLQLTCSDCGQEFTFSSEDQAFFRNVAILLRNGARRVARQRRTNRAEGEDTTGANRKARRLPVPGVGSKPQCRLSRGATGLYIARTASDLERETVSAEEGVGIAVSKMRHFRRMAAIWRELQTAISRG
jgi:hypothetical protein